MLTISCASPPRSTQSPSPASSSSSSSSSPLLLQRPDSPWQPTPAEQQQQQQQQQVAGQPTGTAMAFVLDGGQQQKPRQLTVEERAEAKGGGEEKEEMRLLWDARSCSVSRKDMSQIVAGTMLSLDPATAALLTSKLLLGPRLSSELDCLLLLPHMHQVLRQPLLVHPRDLDAVRIKHQQRLQQRQKGDLSSPVGACPQRSPQGWSPEPQLPQQQQQLQQQRMQPPPPPPPPPGAPPPPPPGPPPQTEPAVPMITTSLIMAPTAAAAPVLPLTPARASATATVMAVSLPPGVVRAAATPDRLVSVQQRELLAEKHKKKFQERGEHRRPCFGFTCGLCTHKDKCKYVHDPHFPTPDTRDLALTICKRLKIKGPGRSSMDPAGFLAPNLPCAKTKAEDRPARVYCPLFLSLLCRSDTAIFRSTLASAVVYEAARAIVQQQSDTLTLLRACTGMTLPALAGLRVRGKLHEKHLREQRTSNERDKQTPVIAPPDTSHLREAAAVATADASGGRDNQAAHMPDSRSQQGAAHNRNSGNNNNNNIRQSAMARLLAVATTSGRLAQSSTRASRASDRRQSQRSGGQSKSTMTTSATEGSPDGDYCRRNHNSKPHAQMTGSPGATAATDSAVTEPSPRLAAAISRARRQASRQANSAVVGRLARRAEVAAAKATATAAVSNNSAVSPLTQVHLPRSPARAVSPYTYVVASAATVKPGPSPRKQQHRYPRNRQQQSPVQQQLWQATSTNSNASTTSPMPKIKSQVLSPSTSDHAESSTQVALESFYGSPTRHRQQSVALGHTGPQLSAERAFSDTSSSPTSTTSATSVERAVPDPLPLQQLSTPVTPRVLEQHQQRHRSEVPVTLSMPNTPPRLRTYRDMAATQQASPVGSGPPLRALAAAKEANDVQPIAPPPSIPELWAPREGTKSDPTPTSSLSLPDVQVHTDDVSTPDGGPSHLHKQRIALAPIDDAEPARLPPSPVSPPPGFSTAPGPEVLHPHHDEPAPPVGLAQHGVSFGLGFAINLVDRSTVPSPAESGHQAAASAQEPLVLAWRDQANT